VTEEQHSLNAALHVVTGPLDLASISLEVKVVLAGLAVLEPKNTTVFADKHHAGAWLNFFARKVANSSFWHGITVRSVFEPRDPCP
jgi:hypothetical protein